MVEPVTVEELRLMRPEARVWTNVEVLGIEIDAERQGVQKGLEMAAQKASDTASRWRKYPSYLREEWNREDEMRAIECDRLAAAIRAILQDHI